MRRGQNKQGFTIVELLIVIVVIGILAAITMVAYNGIQGSARFAAYRSDIQSINKAILLYYAENGYYPGSAAGSCATNQSTGTGNFIPGTPALAPTYIQKIPDVINFSGGQNYYAYCYTTNGADYKIMRLVPGGATLPANETTNNPNIDPVRPTRAWGYWSPGCAASC
ncbi:MAG: type II secretion system protein [Patescibacteria group bacterium]